MIRKTDLWLLGLKAPAPAERRVVPPAAPAATPLRNMTELYPAWSAHPRGRLRIALGCSLHWGRARRLIGDYHAQFFDVDLEIADLDEACAVADVLSGECDAAILPQGEVAVGLRAGQLWSERLLAALPEGDARAAANVVDPAELRDEPILIAGAAESQLAFRKALVKALDGPPSVVLHQNVDRDTLFDLVALGFGIAIVPGAAGGAFFPGVNLRPIANPAAEIT